MWHTKIDRLTALTIKWGQIEEKILPAHFQLVRAQLSRFGTLFQNFILKMVVIYQKRLFSWTIIKMGSEVEKMYGLTFGSSEPFWELISELKR